MLGLGTALRQSQGGESMMQRHDPRPERAALRDNIRVWWFSTGPLDDPGGSEECGAAAEQQAEALRRKRQSRGQSDQLGPQKGAVRPVVASVGPAGPGRALLPMAKFLGLPVAVE
ncbi:hypothetical protein NDU88_000964 [Pleurodeles waltl]|uniref:Uncharacterized protein n=1 Tax=Pleurodeles waltl TaxID=8319 RepID=A0AAV7N9L3_PLEWA|nr:hypothetical protein NDU88_000964 [Pleurodeles waltl]